MLRMILKWGVISGGVMAALLMGSYLLFPGTKPGHFESAEIAGYVGMLVSLSVIYFAIAAHFSGANAAASVWQRVKLGLGVGAVSAVIFGIFDTVYVNFINPGFMQNYFEYYLTKVPELSGPEGEAVRAQIEADFALFSSPFMVFLVMAVTVFLISIPVSAVSALVHKLVVSRQTPV